MFLVRSSAIHIQFFQIGFFKSDYHIIYLMPQRYELFFRIHKFVNNLSQVSPIKNRHIQKNLLSLWAFYGII